MTCFGLLDTRVGRLVFWMTVAPILMAIDLGIMIVTFDRDRLAAVAYNLSEHVRTRWRRSHDRRA